MLRQIAIGEYDHDPGDTYGLNIKAVGTGFRAIGTVHKTGVEEVPHEVTPDQYAGGAPSYEVNVVVTFTEASTEDAAYTILFIDSAGTVVDANRIRLAKGAALPKDVRATFVMHVVGA